MKCLRSKVSPKEMRESNFTYQDLPCTLNWGYMVPNSGYLGPNRGSEEGLGTFILIDMQDA